MSGSDLKARWFRESVAPYAASESLRGHRKLSVSLPQDLVDVIKVVAAESGMSVSATIAASLRRTLVDSEQARLDAALALDADEDRAWAAAAADVHAHLVSELEW